MNGELDLVALDRGVLVFCEVKARRRSVYGGAAAAVGPAKQAQVRHLAQSWLRCRSEVDYDGIRFDVVTIDGVRLRWWKGAF